ncbi:MAG TPA: hypothetical protein VKS79_15945 [Gemmataceae bacterium]|nr:hypothetical protein [Gemmataceae bacterium]
MKTRTLFVATTMVIVTTICIAIGSGSLADDKPLPLTPNMNNAIVPEPIAAKIVEIESKEIQKILTEPKVGNKDRKRAIALGVVIAGMADEHSKDPKFAAIRGQAVRVIDALTKENLSEAKDLVNKLLEGTASPKPGKLELHMAFWDAPNNDFDREMAMQLFKSQRAGGKGIEIAIKGWAAAAPNVNQMDRARDVAYEVRILADVIQKVGPKEAIGNKLLADWVKFSEALKEAASEAATKKKPGDMQKAMNKLDTACAGCHAVFKKNN